MRNYFVTVIFILLLSFSVYLYFAPADEASVLEENRNPQEMPVFSLKTVSDGSFEADFDKYVNDNIALRGDFMEMARNMKLKYGFTPKNGGRIIFAKSDIGTAETLDYRLILYGDKIMEVFESHPITRKKYSEAINKIYRSLPEDTDMYVMIVPTQLEIFGGKFASIQDSQKDEIEKIYSELDKGIKTVDVHAKLKKAAQSEDDLFFRTDHHWTADGSYCGYEAILDKMGMELTPKNYFERKVLGNFYGSLYFKAKESLYKEQSMDTCYFYDTESANDLYMKMRAEDGVTEFNEGTPIFRTDLVNYKLFTGGDNPLIEITNNGKPDGKSILIIKDSYANALVPWLVNDFKVVTVIDPRSFGGDIREEIKRYDADAVLILNYLFSSTFNDYCEILSDIAKGK